MFQAIPLSSDNTRVVYSKYNPDTLNYSLMSRTFDGVVSVIQVPPRTVPFDVSLGTDKSGDEVALYSRCDEEGHGAYATTSLPDYFAGRNCDIYIHNFTTSSKNYRYGQTRSSASAGGINEAYPVMKRGYIAFLRQKGSGSDRKVIYRTPNATSGRSVLSFKSGPSSQNFLALTYNYRLGVAVNERLSGSFSLGGRLLSGRLNTSHPSLKTLSSFSEDGNTTNTRLFGLSAYGSRLFAGLSTEGDLREDRIDEYSTSTNTKTSSSVLDDAPAWAFTQTPTGTWALQSPANLAFYQATCTTVTGPTATAQCTISQQG